MALSADRKKRLIALFKDEVGDHLRRLSGLLLDLEKGLDGDELKAAIEEVFRSFHTIKGSAKVLNVSAIQAVAHSLEDLFSEIRRGRRPVEERYVDVSLAALDVIGACLEANLETTESDPAVNGILDRLRTIREAPADPAAPPGDSGTPTPAESPSKGQVPAPPPPAGEVPPPAAAPAPPSPAPPPPSSTSVSMPQGARAGRAPDRVPARGSYETIRVTTEKLDSLMNKVGELVIAKIKADQRLKDIRELSQLLDASMVAVKMIRSALPAFAGQPALVTLSQKNDELEEALKNLDRKTNSLEREFSNDVARMDLISRDLEDDIRTLRLLPISDLVDPFFRMVRDLAKDLGKKAELRIDGGETEVDKKVLESLRDPLLHLLRNALDHGVEPPGEREAQGKPPGGTIRIRTFQRGMSIQMEISDDGRGIDPEKIREAVVRKGYYPPERAASMSADQLLALLFEPGFSTSDKVTEVSGRGVGLDVVRDSLSSFNGTIEIRSEVGHGTTFVLVLPLTLITTQALLIRCGKQTLAMPSIAVEKTLEIHVKDVRKLDTRNVILLDGRPVVYMPLGRCLNLSVAPLAPDARTHVLVLSDGSRRVAIQTDEIEGEQEVVHKSLGANFVRVRNIAGATILGTGTVVLMLNPQDLIRTALSITRTELVFEPARQRKARILLVEDSFATRAYEQEILESAGFEVLTAPDGIAALDILAAERVDGVITDIEMPRLDGLRLTRRIRSDAQFKSLPVVIVSSLNSEDARQKGLEVGADAYVVKGEFEKESFLNILQDLVVI